MDPITIGIIIGVAVLGAGGVCGVKIYKDAKLNKQHAEFQEEKAKAQKWRERMEEMLRKKDEIIEKLSKENESKDDRLAKEVRNREKLAKIIDALSAAVKNADGFAVTTVGVAASIGGRFTSSNRALRSYYAEAIPAVRRISVIAERIVTGGCEDFDEMGCELVCHAETLLSVDKKTKLLGAPQ